MNDILFSDGLDICLYNGGKLESSPSAFVENYRRNRLKAKDRDAWKRQGVGARFRGDEEFGSETESAEEGAAAINGLCFESDSSVFYSVTIGQMSGIFRKDFGSDGAPESHKKNLELILTRVTNFGIM